MTYTVGAAFGGTRTGVTLVLAGVAVVSLVTAVQTFLLQRNTEVVREVYSWILGHAVDGAVGRRPARRCPTSIVSSIVLLLHRRHLDLLRVGDDEASSLGVAGRPGAPRRRARGDARDGGGRRRQRADRVRRHRRAAPHPARRRRRSYRRVLPLSVLLGAAFLILADIPGRVLTDPAETPIGVVTAFLGAPFFLVVLRARTR